METIDESVYEVDFPVTGNVYKDISAMADRLAALQEEYDAAEQITASLKKELETLRNVTLPNFMKMNGLTEVKTSEGAKVSIVTKFACSPNKSPSDRYAICKWLQSKGLGDIVKEKAVVDKRHIPLLEDYSIEYGLETDINTNTLKAALKEALGYKEGHMAVMTEEEIPKQIHFFKWEEAKVEV